MKTQVYISYIKIYMFAEYTHLQLFCNQKNENFTITHNDKKI